jgi:hypothetical protein
MLLCIHLITSQDLSNTTIKLEECYCKIRLDAGRDDDNDQSRQNDSRLKRQRAYAVSMGELL